MAQASGTQPKTMSSECCPGLATWVPLSNSEGMKTVRPLPRCFSSLLIVVVVYTMHYNISGNMRVVFSWVGSLYSLTVVEKDHRRPR